MCAKGMIDAVELGPVAVDGSRVERVATNALLMLVSAAETAQAQQLRIYDYRRQRAHAGPPSRASG